MAHEYTSSSEYRQQTGSNERNPPVIRTPDQHVRVFISSMLDELAPERQAARETIAQLRLTPVLFESGARPSYKYRFFTSGRGHVPTLGVFVVFFLVTALGLSCFWGAVMVWGQGPARKMPTGSGSD